MSASDLAVADPSNTGDGDGHGLILTGILWLLSQPATWCAITMFAAGYLGIALARKFRPGTRGHLLSTILCVIATASAAVGVVLALGPALIALLLGIVAGIAAVFAAGTWLTDRAAAWLSRPTKGGAGGQAEP